MAFGFTPKYAQEYLLAQTNLDRKQFLALAAMALEKLSWKIDYTSTNGFMAETRKSALVMPFAIKIVVDDEKVMLYSESIGGSMYDFGKNKKNIRKFLETLEGLRATTLHEDLEKRYEAMIPDFAEAENDYLLQPPATMKDNFDDFVSLFKPVEGYFITPVLLITNLAIFILMVILGVSFINPDVESLLQWGANFRPVTVGGEWWRLVSSTFIHIGVIHVLMNMYALTLIGLLLEPYLGKIRFISAYILTGILASLCSLWWNENSVSAGASGAIFGMYGVFLAMLSTNLIEKDQRKNLLTSIGVFVGYNLIFGLKEGIDNAAHIGGLISGLIIGYGFYPGLKNAGTPLRKFAPIGVGGIATIVLCIVVFENLASSGVPNVNDLIRYEERMEKFYIQESMALEIYNMPETATERELLSEIRNRGIYYWKENIKILNEVDGLELSDNIQDRNKALRKYCELRLELYGLYYAGIDENTNKYETRIMEIDRAIMTILETLGVVED